MIRLKTVRWKNFLATGNRFIEVELDQEPMMLVVGKNGAGKSTIMNIITGVKSPDEGDRWQIPGAWRLRFALPNGLGAA